MKLHTCLFAVPLMFAACGGGGSSIPGSTRIADLTVDQTRELCRDFAADFPLETFTCPGDTEPSSRGTDPAACEGTDADVAINVPDTCPATVGQFRACSEALYSMSDDELCNLQSIPSECAFLLSSDCQEPDQPARTSAADVVARARGFVVR